MRQLNLVALLGLCAVISAGACLAEYPGARVRLNRAAMQNAFPPKVYPDNRVVIRKFTLEPGPNGGLRVRGEVWTDFEVEAGKKPQAGQMTGIKVDVSLSVMRNASEAGAQVPGQFATATVTRVEENLGLASFELPELAKPLPPGTYQLLAMVTFGVQDARVREGLKWCPDWYGGWNEMDDKGRVVNSGLVYGDPVEHDKAYNDLLNQTRSVKDTCHLIVGHMRLGNGGLDFGKPGSETFCCRDRGVDVTDELLLLDKQRKDADDNYKKEKERLEAEKKKSGADVDKLDKQLKRAEELLKIAKQSTERLTALHGGKPSNDELKEHGRVGALRTRLNQQIGEWEDKLREKYWLLLDGYVWYKAYNAIAVAGGNTISGIRANDNQADKTAREEALKKRNADSVAKAAHEKKIKELTDPLPDKIKEAALRFFNKRDESDDWDSSKFLSRDKGKFVLNKSAWRAHVIKVATDCFNDTKLLMGELDTSAHYCVQKWPDAYGQAKAARDNVIALGFGYEFSIRVDLQKENLDAVNDDLTNLAGGNATLGEFIKLAVGNGHSGMQSKINNGMRGAKDGIKLFDFIKRWTKANR